MDQSVDPLTGSMRDLSLDDRDLPLAKNFFDFSTNFCDANPPWARQMIVYINLFGEYCPDCLKDRDRLDPLSIPVDMDSREIAEYLPLLNHGKCPRCKGRKSEFVRSGKMNLYQELDLVWGQRGGKSMSGSEASAYQAHRMLKMPFLANLAPKQLQRFTPLTATFVSLTFSKAYSLLWTPFKSILNMTPWFKEYHSLLDFYGKKQGVELYRVRDEFVKYFHKNLHLYPSHPQASILRGDTRFEGAIDELALFPMPRDKTSDNADETSERANAKEAITSLETSLATVNKVLRTLLIEKGMDHVPCTLLLGLSSPKHQKDMVMRRYRFTQSEEGSKIALGSKLATWEVNPNLPRNDPYIVGKFEADPVAAMRDLGAEPPRTANRFVPSSHIEGERFPFTGQRNLIRLEYEYSEEEVWGILKNANPNRINYPTVLSLDAGYSNNSFAISAVGIDPKSEHKIRVPALIEIIPREGKTINFNKIYKHVLKPFSAAMNSQLWIADRWNSLDLLARAKDDVPNLATTQRTLRPQDFENFIQVLWNCNLVLPELTEKESDEVFALETDDYRLEFTNKPVEHLLNQFITVQHSVNGGCPEKAIGFTDDLFRSVVLGVYAITHPQLYAAIKKNLVRYKSDENQKQGLATFYGRSGPQIAFNRRRR